jgi:GrpB-like predicted nucleotidyltransferase (UPF0157 family)
LPRTIELTPDNPNWPDLYRQEARKISNILREEIILFHHIGSTAIPGMRAKPMIDCLIEVRQIERVDSYDPALISLGYEPRGENGIPGRRYFYKNSTQNYTHHLHILRWIILKSPGTLIFEIISAFIQKMPKPTANLNKMWQ